VPSLLAAKKDCFGNEIQIIAARSHHKTVTLTLPHDLIESAGIIKIEVLGRGGEGGGRKEGGEGFFTLGGGHANSQVYAVFDRFESHTT
jgi:hypothetical protein